MAGAISGWGYTGNTCKQDAFKCIADFGFLGESIKAFSLKLQFAVLVFSH